MNVRKNDPCPCGSGKIAKHCCLQPSGILFKAPTLLALGDPRKQRDGCYLSFAGGCGDKLSREHLMSKGIDARPPNRRRVTAEGVPLNNPYRRADTAKVLCRTHNSMLGPFDTVGARVFSAIGAAIRGQSGKLLIHGYDLERFVLQRIAAHHFAGILTSGGASMAHYHLPQDALTTFFENRLSHPLGLWVASVPIGHNFNDPNAWEVAPLFNRQTGELIGGRVSFGPVGLVLICNRYPLDDTILNVQCYRPRKILLRQGQELTEIKICWQAHSGSTPGIELVATHRLKRPRPTTNKQHDQNDEGEPGDA